MQQPQIYVYASVVYASASDALWLILLSFMLYVLVRIINDCSANLRLMHELGNELMGIPAAEASDRQPTLDQMDAKYYSGRHRGTIMQRVAACHALFGACLRALSLYSKVSLTSPGLSSILPPRRENVSSLSMMLG
ncbi:MAG: hypothetical protein JST60_16570 [Chloroflexi bacterium SZAS-1]|nr:hypothetical protein [Chloroflexi bacterium SZAS-1]